jgi:NAD(P)-dependent dehydrogenase (short-subunit alcohol dehydrogenase family)
MTDLFDLSGKIAVITGSTKGIGRAIAKQMAARGAKVVISSRDKDRCADTAAEINDDGGTAIGIPCNIGYKEQLQALVDGTLKEWGQIDVLVCNAAVNPHFGPMASIEDEAFETILKRNVQSPLWLCNMVIPQMAARKDGAVIVISSIAGLRGDKMLGAYSISKAADMQLVRNLAVEWGKSNVRVNGIAPGLVRTAFASALWENPAILAAVEKGAPLGRIGDPDDIAGAALLLASNAGRFMTGETIVIDGGVTIAGRTSDDLKGF